MAPFPTPLLDAKRVRQQQQAEQERQQLLAQALQWLSFHGKRFGIAGGYLFGSVVQPGRFTAGSDIDLAVETLKEGDPFGLVAYLSLALDRDVDLVPLDQCHFAVKIREKGFPWNASRLPD